MASQRTHDVTATIGEYTNGQGEKKKRYINVGSAFTDDQGRVSIKLDAVPTNPEWSGWLSLYPVREREGGQQQAAPPRERQTTQQLAHQATQQKGWDAHDAVDDGDDIPF